MTSLDLPQYRSLVEHSPTMVWRAGLDGKCDYFNATWLDFTGRKLEQEVGDGWAEGVHPEDIDACLAFYLESFAARRPFEMQYRLRRADGAYRYLFDRGVPYTDSNGDFAGFIGSCVDIDDRPKAEQARQVFISMVAHELRTPLMTLQTSTTLLRRRAAAGKDVEPTLATIDRQVARFSRMVTSLSEISQLEAGVSLALDVAPTCIWDLLRHTVEEREEALGAEAGASHSLTLEAPTTPLEVLADGERLRGVLLHVIDNAIKYSPRGGEIKVRGEVVDGSVALSVSDSGIGIPEAEQALVFGRFFRASNASPENFPGVGLGLFVARGIVEAHGGTLSLQSKLNEGTTVKLTLPLRAERAES